MRNAKIIEKVKFFLIDRPTVIVRSGEYAGTPTEAAEDLRNAGFTVDCKPSGNMIVTK